MAASLSIAAFIAALLVLIPLPSHWRSRNVAILSLIAWLFVVDVIYGVNTIVWSGNAEVRIVVWCDITTRIMIGASSALPAAAMCICKHLELVASGRAVRLTHGDRRRRMFLESAMCFGIPFVLMALFYVVQGHRFDIVEDIGCQPATYYSIPAVFVVWFPPLFLSTATLIYAGLALRHFFRQRLHFATHLQSCDSALSTGRYLRLIAMSITEMVWGTSLTALAMYNNISPGLYPYISWSYVHSDFSRIGQFPLVEIDPASLWQIFLLFWAIPASSFIFFVFFGFGEEAIKDYHKAVAWFARKVLRIRVKQDKAAFSSLPVCRPSLSTAKFSSSFSPSTEFSDDKTLPAYTPCDRDADLEKHAPPSPSTPSPPSPAQTETGTYITTTIRTSTLSDAELDDLLARCPSVSSGVPSPNSPVEFRVPDAYGVGRPVAVPSPAHHHRPLSSPSYYSDRSSAAATCAASLAHVGAPGGAERDV